MVIKCAPLTFMNVIYIYCSIYEVDIQTVDYRLTLMLL